jgi:hypothetical protein
MKSISEVVCFETGRPTPDCSSVFCFLFNIPGKLCAKPDNVEQHQLDSQNHECFRHSPNWPRRACAGGVPNLRQVPNYRRLLATSDAPPFQCSSLLAQSMLARVYLTARNNLESTPARTHLAYYLRPPAHVSFRSGYVGRVRAHGDSITVVSPNNGGPVTIEFGTVIYYRASGNRNN